MDFEGRNSGFHLIAEAIRSVKNRAGRWSRVSDGSLGSSTGWASGVFAKKLLAEKIQVLPTIFSYFRRQIVQVAPNRSPG